MWTWRFRCKSCKNQCLGMYVWGDKKIPDAIWSSLIYSFSAWDLPSACKPLAASRSICMTAEEYKLYIRSMLECLIVYDGKLLKESFCVNCLSSKIFSFFHNFTFSNFTFHLNYIWRPGRCGLLALTII